jgi:hypothetical protein
MMLSTCNESTLTCPCCGSDWQCFCDSRLCGNCERCEIHCHCGNPQFDTKAEPPCGVGALPATGASSFMEGRVKDGFRGNLGRPVF